MSVPGNGNAITLGKIRMELRATSQNNNYDDGPFYGQTSLTAASTNNHETMNPLNQQVYNNGPNQATPHEMSEWHGYDHLLMS